MRFRRVIANVCGVVSTLWLACAVTVALLLDAPAFSFAVEPVFLGSFLLATTGAIAASIFGSRWWLISVALWALPAALSIMVLAHYR
jgi:hypothetical protein